MRRSTLAAGAAMAVAVLGSAGEAAAQRQSFWVYCLSYDSRNGDNQRVSELFAVDDAAAVDRPGPHWRPSPSVVDQQWYAQEGLPRSGRLGKCDVFSSEVEARRKRDEDIQRARRSGLSVQSVSWRPAGSRPSTQAATAPPPVEQAAPPPSSPPPSSPPPSLPSLVVRDTSAEDAERARQLNEENARRNREAAERDAAARARYEQQQRDHEAAMARHRAAQERYRRECESNRAKGGSCVISR